MGRSLKLSLGNVMTLQRDLEKLMSTVKLMLGKRRERDHYGKKGNAIGKMMFAVAETKEWRDKEAAFQVWVLQITVL